MIFVSTRKVYQSTLVPGHDFATLEEAQEAEAAAQERRDLVALVALAADTEPERENQ